MLPPSQPKAASSCFGPPMPSPWFREICRVGIRAALSTLVLQFLQQYREAGIITTPVLQMRMLGPWLQAAQSSRWGSYPCCRSPAGASLSRSCELVRRCQGFCQPPSLLPLSISQLPQGLLFAGRSPTSGRSGRLRLLSLGYAEAPESSYLKTTRSAFTRVGSFNFTTIKLIKLQGLASDNLIKLTECSSIT